MLRGTQYLACGRNLSSINIHDTHTKKASKCPGGGGRCGGGGGALDSFDKFT